MLRRGCVAKIPSERFVVCQNNQATHNKQPVSSQHRDHTASMDVEGIEVEPNTAMSSRHHCNSIQSSILDVSTRFTVTKPNANLLNTTYPLGIQTTDGWIIRTMQQAPVAFSLLFFNSRCFHCVFSSASRIRSHNDAWIWMTRVLGWGDSSLPLCVVLSLLPVPLATCDDTRVSHAHSVDDDCQLRWMHQSRRMWMWNDLSYWHAESCVECDNCA
jgi:hypothetical protein